MKITTAEGLVPQWYTPFSEKDETTPARFKVRGLTGAQMEEGYFGCITTDRELQLTPSGRRFILECGVLDWENVNDENDRPLAFSKYNIDFLPMVLRRELVLQILSDSRLEEEDTKNS